MGGGEYTALMVAEALRDAGFKTFLLCKKVPRLKKYLEAFDVEVPFEGFYLFKYPRLPRLAKLFHYLLYPVSTPNVKVDLYFNTSADSHPFAIPLHAIIHYKPVVYYVTALPLTPPWLINNKDEQYLTIARKTYWSYFRKSAKNIWSRVNGIFIACSRFVAKQLKEAIGKDPQILYTPVDVSKYIWRGEKKRDVAIVMGRTVPSKRYEEAILACMKAGVRLIMLLAIHDKAYYQKLLKLVRELNLQEKVKIITNAPVSVRSALLRRAKVFIHCRVEAGAKAVREAMAAGCIPIVPALGGQAEYVPKEYHFSSFDELSEKIKTALNEPMDIRKALINEVMEHDSRVFKRRLTSLLEECGVL